MKMKCREPIKGKAQMHFHEAYDKPCLMQRELRLSFYRAGGTGDLARGEFLNHHHSLPRYGL